MKSMHDKKFATSAVALVKGRIRDRDASLNSRDFLDELVKKTGFLDKAPFLWIGVTIFYGIKNDLKCRFRKIDPKDGELEVGLELDMEILQWADKNNLDLLRDIFMIAGLEVILQVGKKYKLPTHAFEEERKKYGNIPNTIEECESYSR